MHYRVSLGHLLSVLECLDSSPSPIFGSSCLLMGSPGGSRWWFSGSCCQPVWHSSFLAPGYCIRKVLPRSCLSVFQKRNQREVWHGAVMEQWA